MIYFIIDLSYTRIYMPPDVEIMVNLGLKGLNVLKIRCNEIVQHIMGLKRY